MTKCILIPCQVPHRGFCCPNGLCWYLRIRGRYLVDPLKIATLSSACTRHVTTASEWSDAWKFITSTWRLRRCSCNHHGEKEECSRHSAYVGSYPSQAPVALTLQATTMGHELNHPRNHIFSFREDHADPLPTSTLFSSLRTVQMLRR